jgi:hypothetical protein
LFLSIATDLLADRRHNTFRLRTAHPFAIGISSACCLVALPPQLFDLIVHLVRSIISEDETMTLSERWRKE